jgi:hypothetical protein
MGWETINLLLNFAEKLGSNFSNMKTIQFIHSYLHTLDVLNFEIPDPKREEMQEKLDNLRLRLTNLTNPEINQLELALNINCSGYLLKNIAGQFYFPNNRNYYIRSAVASHKRRTYSDPIDILVVEPPVINPLTPTTITSFCDGLIEPA